jgi:hypothetical protein
MSLVGRFTNWVVEAGTGVKELQEAAGVVTGAVAVAP